MNISRTTNNHHYDSPNHQRPTHANRKSKSKIAEEKMLLKYKKNTDECVQNIRRFVERYYVTYSMPFSQASFNQLIYKKYPAIVSAIPPDKIQSGLSLGLALTWLKQQLNGKSNEEYHQSLLNLDHDSTLLQVLGSQHITQFQRNDNDSNSAALEHAAPRLDLEPISTSKHDHSWFITADNFQLFGRELEEIWRSPLDQQAISMVLNENLHATAMFRDKENNLHWFNPNIGVISSSFANRFELYNLVIDFIENTYVDEKQLYATEFQLKPESSSNVSIHSSEYV